MAPSATRRAAELKFSPCGEQFGCIEEGGSLCLWRFQSGTDVPLPFSRLQCHGKRGADLCFVGTSVVVATVGLSVGLTAPSLCLWDVLLPPSQALITSCAAHSEGGCCVLHSPSDMSLISGRSMVTSASSQQPMRPPTAPEAHPLAQGCPPSGPERGAFATWMPGEAAAETLVPARSRRFHLRVNHGLPPGGGQKGEMVIFDLRQQRQRAQWSAHSLATRSLALDATTEFCFSASSDGDIKLWDLAPATPCPCCPCSRVATLINPAVATLVRLQPCVVEAATLCAQVGHQAVSCRRRVEPARPRRRACGRRAAAEAAGLLAQGARAAHDAARRPRAANRPHLRGGEAHLVRPRPVYQRRLRRRVPHVAHSSRSHTRAVVTALSGVFPIIKSINGDKSIKYYRARVHLKPYTAISAIGFKVRRL